MTVAKLLPGFVPHEAEIAGVPTRWFEGGRAEADPPLLLVHGLGGSATNWTALAPLLARRRRVLVPDLPGHGRSAPLPRLQSLSDLAGHVAALARERGFLPCATVGHSMGGIVALRLAVLEPDAVLALALVGSAGIESTSARARRGLAVTAVLQPAKRVSRARGRIAASPLLRRAVFGYWGAGDAASLSPESVLGFLEGPAHATDVAGAARLLVTDDPRTDLHRVRCPTVVLWGARDRMTPLADGMEFARRLGASLRVVGGAGHLLPAEQPATCAAILERFLGSCAVTPSLRPVIADGRLGKAQPS